MITFCIAVLALVLGYLLYGRFVDRIFKPNPDRKTPAYTRNDGVDFVPMPLWRVFMIQFLNIAGTGPIFGAIMGAMFGPACYLWIVFGCIFAGAFHDYFSGMISLRYNGISLPDIIGYQLGDKAKNVMLAFCAVLLLLVGAVFIYSPAVILGGMTEGIAGGKATSTMFWVGVVLVYYIIATIVPIDKIIGTIYPVFAVALIFMALSLLVCLFVKWPAIPELWDGLQNRNPDNGSIFPCMFITIACGAISGFHATQSPLMARCLKNEKMGRSVFYGSMIVEGIVALVWAAIGSYFFHGGGAQALGIEGVKDAPTVVNAISKSWLGIVGSFLALLGVVAAPVTSGDTALRSCRLIVSDAFGLDQKSIGSRLKVSIPIFIVAGGLLAFNITNKDGFNMLWQYFSWANQCLSIFTLWAITFFLYRRKVAGHTKRNYWWFALVPACFMTSVCLTFITTAKIGFNVTDDAIPYLGAAFFMVPMLLFLRFRSRITHFGNPVWLEEEDDAVTDDVKSAGTDEPEKKNPEKTVF